VLSAQCSVPSEMRGTARTLSTPHSAPSTQHSAREKTRGGSGEPPRFHPLSSCRRGRAFDSPWDVPAANGDQAAPRRRDAADTGREGVSGVARGLRRSAWRHLIRKSRPHVVRRTLETSHAPTRSPNGHPANERGSRWRDYTQRSREAGKDLTRPTATGSYRNARRATGCNSRAG
jgi:hypothetical protein